MGHTDRRFTSGEEKLLKQTKEAKLIAMDAIPTALPTAPGTRCICTSIASASAATRGYRAPRSRVRPMSSLPSYLVTIAFEYALVVCR